ncbi:hypothetical protein [uncultured Bacteroides sp.]|uniref:hypothetical protein n=1 Tax=uncultured Bacteroides sp. TaxID=162156 RepID=UPI0025E964BC|nr:hypothetical protein [uncultured Bacteroides sp.]
MKKDYETIVKEIVEHLSKSGKRYYSDFYIGITNDVEQRMFKEHNVPKEKNWWIFRTAENSDIAREVENHFLKLGMRGDNKGGDDTSNVVYCYAVTPTTAE